MATAFKVAVPPLPDGYEPVEVVAVVKCLDGEGHPKVVVRTSDGVSVWEAACLLIAMSDRARANLQGELITWDETEDDGLD